MPQKLLFTYGLYPSIASFQFKVKEEMLVLNMVAQLRRETEWLGSLAMCFGWQVELYGKLSDSLLVSVVLMLVYITKFFWWESGYWNSMDIAHDRGESSCLFNLTTRHP
jgi:hypothetical protein